MISFARRQYRCFGKKPYFCAEQKPRPSGDLQNQTFYMKKLLVLLPLVILLAAFKAPEAPVKNPEIPADIQALLEKYGCTACHAMGRKLVGPKWPEIAAKGYSVKKIAALVKKPEPSNWPGYAPMTPQKNVPTGDLNKIATWLTSVK